MSVCQLRSVTDYKLCCGNILQQLCIQLGLTKILKYISAFSRSILWGKNRYNSLLTICFFVCLTFCMTEYFFLKIILAKTETDTFTNQQIQHSNIFLETQDLFVRQCTEYLRGKCIDNFIQTSEISVKTGIYNHQQKCQQLIMFTIYTYTFLKVNYATVGASLLIKEMLLRHSLLTKRGHEGFIIRCSTTILSSVKRVRQYGFLREE